MRRSNRCRWILPFSIFSPSSSFFLVSNQNSIRNQFSLFRQNSSIKSSLRSSHLSHFLMNHGQVNAAFSIRKSVQRIEEKQKWRAERRDRGLSPKTAYFNVIAISQVRPRHHRYQQDVRRRVKLTTAHVNEHRWTVYRQLGGSLRASYRRGLIVERGEKLDEECARPCLDPQIRKRSST